MDPARWAGLAFGLFLLAALGLIAYLSAKHDAPAPWVRRLNEAQRRHPLLWLGGIWAVIVLATLLMGRVPWVAVLFALIATVRTLREKSHSDAA